MKLRFSVPYQLVLCALLCLLLAPATLRAVTLTVPSSPPERVVDLANIIEPALEVQLISALRELEEKTTAQIAILTVSSLGGETIEAFSLRTAEQWKLGQKGKDNGLLLTVALKERKYRFETGYGLESVLPDSLLGSIGRGKLVPFFKEGKYGQGIAAAIKEVLAVLAKNYNVQFSHLNESPENKKAISSDYFHHRDDFKDKVFILLFAIFIGLIVIGSNFSFEKRYYILSMISGVISWFFWETFSATFFAMMVIAVICEIFFGKKGSGSGTSSRYDSWSSSDSSSSNSDSSFSGGGGESGGGGSSGDW